MQRLPGAASCAAPADIEYEGGADRIAGTDRVVGLAELVQRNLGALDSKAELPGPPAYLSGAHVATSRWTRKLG